MTRLWLHFQEGGWFMYPIFALGLIAVGSAGRFALRGEHQLIEFVRWLTAAMLLSGSFGFILGIMRVLTASQISNPMLAAHIVMEGITEAANVPAAALMFSVIVCLCVAVGQRRFPLPNPSAVAR